MRRVNAFRGWKEQPRTERKSWPQHPLVPVLLILLPLVLLRFRKAEGGIEAFAEGYKVFGFQRPTWIGRRESLPLALDGSPQYLGTKRRRSGFLLSGCPPRRESSSLETSMAGQLGCAAARRAIAKSGIGDACRISQKSKEKTHPLTRGMVLWLLCMFSEFL